MRKIVIVLGLALIAFAWAGAQTVLRCAICNKPVVGKYIEYDGKVFCSQECFVKSMPKCAWCGKSIAEGKGKAGDYVISDGKYYCSDECFIKSLKKCSVCGKPVQKGLRDGQNPARLYCSQECYRTTLPRCAKCGEIMQSWIEIEGVKFCSQCSKLPACFNCLLPGASKEAKDGRKWCDSCFARAMNDSTKALELFLKVREDIGSHLGLSTNDTITFHLVDADQLGQLLGHKQFAERGFYQYNISYRKVKNKKVIDGEKFEIYLLSGLSPENFKDVAAHELAHDLNYRMFPNARQKQDVEGFAEYVSGQMNTYWGQEQVNQTKARNQQKDYAAAYLYFLKLGEKDGLKGVLAHMEKQNREGNKKKPKTTKQKPAKN
jgi:ribosomal protein L24E